MTNKLYVGNLPYNIDDSSLREIFEAEGQVESARVITERETGRSKGFGFVEMATDQQAETAIEVLHETEVSGRRLSVSEARPQNDSQGPRRQGGFRRERY